MKKKELFIAFLKELRTNILAQFEKLEGGSHFQKKKWDYQGGEGGGEIGILRGNVFEKAAVNFSAISGETFPTQEVDGPFFATGVSLITHMVNPHAPTVHMNMRYIETSKKSWFGGGYDLTPMGFPYKEDTESFHSAAKQNLDSFQQGLYEEFSQKARDYFYIPHWGKERGVGGIFFDYYNSGNFERDFGMLKGIGRAFLESILPIYQRRIHQPYSEEERERQLYLRAHYVEFNLLYDRGTRFGFLSGGNPEAILCSMPPLVRW